MSAFTPNPPLSISPSDDPADLPGTVRFPNPLYDPNSHFLDDTDSLESIEGSVPSAPRNLSLVIVTARFVTLRWQEPENVNGNVNRDGDGDGNGNGNGSGNVNGSGNGNGEILNYYIYFKQEGVQR